MFHPCFKAEKMKMTWLPALDPGPICLGQAFHFALAAVSRWHFFYQASRPPSSARLAFLRSFLRKYCPTQPPRHPISKYEMKHMFEVNVTNYVTGQHDWRQNETRV